MLSNSLLYALETNKAVTSGLKFRAPEQSHSEVKARIHPTHGLVLQDQLTVPNGLSMKPESRLLHWRISAVKALLGVANIKLTACFDSEKIIGGNLASYHVIEVCDRLVTSILVIVCRCTGARGLRAEFSPPDGRQPGQSELAYRISLLAWHLAFRFSGVHS